MKDMDLELARQIQLQRRWMNQCGGTLLGYVRTYGSQSDPVHTGEGGEAIYAADKAFLNKLLEWQRDRAAKRKVRGIGIRRPSSTSAPRRPRHR
jgi:hypothetical protein